MTPAEVAALRDTQERRVAEGRKWLHLDLPIARALLDAYEERGRLATRCEELAAQYVDMAALHLADEQTIKNLERKNAHLVAALLEAKTLLDIALNGLECESDEERCAAWDQLADSFGGRGFTVGIDAALRPYEETTDG